MSPGCSLKVRALLVAAVAALFASDSTWAEPKLGNESPDFPPIYFYAGSSELDEESRERCQNVASHMLKNPSLRLTVRGGTDPTGSVAINKRLGRQRADAAKRAIVGKGVAANRIKVVRPQLASEGGENRFLRFVKFYFTGTASVAAAPVSPTPPAPSAGKTSAPSIAKTSASGTSAPSRTPSGPDTLRVIFWRAWATSATRG
jgi:hypothetical protein